MKIDEKYLIQILDESSNVLLVEPEYKRKYPLHPQQYKPLNILNRNKRFIGKLWTPNLVKAFRFFWLMSGYFIKQEFSDFMASEKCNVKLSKEDFAAYENSTLQ